MNDYYPPYLAHYGVLGMKWGVRKKSKSRSNGFSFGSHKHYSKDYTDTKDIRKKSSKELSNDQLRVLNKRMGLEQDYNRLSTSAVHKGEAYAKRALAVGTLATGLYTFAKSDLVKKGISVIKNARS